MKVAECWSTEGALWLPAPSGCDVHCSVCGEPITFGQMVVDREVWKCGELDYIELAHDACVPADKRA